MTKIVLFNLLFKIFKILFQGKKLEFSRMSLNFFTNFVLPPTILMLALFGNIMGFVIVGRKNLEKIGPVLIFKFLFTSDTIYISLNLIYILVFCLF